MTAIINIIGSKEHCGFFRRIINITGNNFDSITPEDKEYLKVLKDLEEKGELEIINNIFEESEMNKETINDIPKQENSFTGSNSEEEFKKMLASSTSNSGWGNGNMWLSLLTLIFLQNKSTDSLNSKLDDKTLLEKEVSYLHGKIDTLEKLISK